MTEQRSSRQRRRSRIRVLLAGALVIATAGCAAEPALSSAGASQRPVPVARTVAASVAGSVAPSRSSAPPARVPIKRSASRRALESSEPRQSPPLGTRTGGTGARFAHGVILPNSRRTPGAANPAVTPATISSTICVVGWTARVRPSSSYTTALKRQQLASGYAWRGDRSTADYEEDHLIPLELGGSPFSPANLWPEPYEHSGDEGAVSKDAVENRLHDLVCSGAVSLRTAQRAIAGDWWLAARRYASVPVTRSRSARPQPVAARHTSAPPPARHGCTTSSSGSCIRGGQFCPKARYGQTGYDASGTPYECTGNASHPRWE